MFILLLGSAPSLQAQGDEAQRSQAPQRATDAQHTAQRAAELSAAYQALGLDHPVPYHEVLANPDDIDLNVRFAKTQTAEGDTLGASATLERILMIQPLLAPARLFYAMVLMRLERYPEAKQELASLNQLPALPSEIRATVIEYLREVSKRERRTQWTSTTTVGFQYDRNRNAASSTKEQLFADARLPLTGTSRRRHDTSLLVVQGLEVAHDLGFQAGHELLGSFTYYDGEQTRVNDLDLQSFTLDTGPKLKLPWCTLTAQADLNQTTLSRESYVRSQGVKTRLERQLTPRLAAFAAGDWKYENFDGINESQTAFLRAGGRTTVALGGSYTLTPTMKLDSDIQYDRKSAKADFYAFHGLTLTGSHTWILPGGQFVINTLEYGYDHYDAPDYALSAMERDDRHLTVRATYGIPVGLLLPKWQALEPIVADLTAIGSFEQTRYLSTVANYSYANSKFDVMMTKRIEF